MSLAPRDRQALARIEDSLRSTDPRLAAMLTTFTVITSHRKIPRWRCLSPWRLRIRRFVPLTLAVALIAGGLVLFSTLSQVSHAPATPGGCGTAITQLASCPGTGASHAGQDSAGPPAPHGK